MSGVGRQPLTGKLDYPTRLGVCDRAAIAADLSGRWHRRVRPARGHQSRHSGSGARDRPPKCEEVPLAAQRRRNETPSTRFPSLSSLSALPSPGLRPWSRPRLGGARTGRGRGGSTVPGANGSPGCPSLGGSAGPRASPSPARGPRAGIRGAPPRWRVAGWVARERDGKEGVRRELPPERVAGARGHLGDLLTNSSRESCLWGRSVAMAAGEAFGAAT